MSNLRSLTVILMAAFTLALSSVRSETEVPANAIKLWIALGQTNLVIGQSLDVVVRMRNESDQPLPQEYSVRNASICISYEDEPPTRYVGGFAGKKSGRRLAPGHTETITSALLYCGYCPVGGGEERAGRYVFNKPGRYRIGACLGDCFPPQVGFCSPVGVVTVSEPVGTDLIVWKKLVNHPLYAEVVEGVVRSAQAKDLKTLEDIARENPTSAYAPSIFLGLGACYQSNGKLVEACSWYERLLDYTDNLLIKQQAQVRYAEALRDMGQLDKSIVLAEEILENDRETPFRDTLEALTKNPLRTTGRDDLLRATISELEARGYDLIDFSRNAPAEYEAQTFQLLKDLDAGVITQFEYNQNMAAALKEYVVTYAKPLSPEEWQGRKDQYAMEQAAADTKARELSEKLEPVRKDLRKKLDAKEISANEYNRLLWQAQQKLLGRPESPTPFD